MIGWLPNLTSILLVVIARDVVVVSIGGCNPVKQKQKVVLVLRHVVLKMYLFPPSTRPIFSLLSQSC
jgi:hypothetical protein